MNKVTRLFHFEDVQIDETVLRDLAREMGERSAQKLVARQLEEIAVHLARAENKFDTGAIENLDSDLYEICSRADHIGLISLTKITQVAANLLSERDVAAFAAVFARMIRIGEMSLVMLSDTEGLSV